MQESAFYFLSCFFLFFVFNSGFFAGKFDFKPFFTNELLIVKQAECSPT
jgi:hypothetical protein